MYEGYVEFAGVEIGNAERVQRYAKNISAGLVREDEEHDGLHVALGDDEYNSPLTDDAPWVDPEDPATLSFLGLYPLKLTGTADSTRESDVTEAIVDGGTVGTPRHATREMRYTAWAFAQDELGLERGLAWLRATAEGPSCGMHSGFCNSSDLRYFLDRPNACESLYAGEIDWTDVTETKMGTLTPSAELSYRYPATRDPDQPVRGAWTLYGTAREKAGVELTWGLENVTTGEVLDAIQEPLLLARVNLVPNPTFNTTTSGLDVRSGPATLTRVASGGADGGAFARATPNDGALIRTNWVPDPRFEALDEGGTWRTNGTASVTMGGLAGGSPTAEFANADLTAGPYAEFTVQGPQMDVAGAETMSIFSAQVKIAAGDSVTIQSLNAGVIVSSSRFTGVTAGQWSRIAGRIRLADGYAVRIVTTNSNALLSIAEPLVEAEQNLLATRDFTSMVGTTGAGAISTFWSNSPPSSLRMPANGGTASYASIGGDVGASTLGLQPGGSYLVTAVARVASGSGPAPAAGLRALALLYTTPAGVIEHQFSASTPAAIGTYVVSGLFSIPLNAAPSARMAVRLYSNINSDEMYWDDVVVTEVGDYFDGSPAFDGVFPGRVMYNWLGDRDDSGSEMLYDGTKRTVNTVENPQANGPRPAINSYRAKTSIVDASPQIGGGAFTKAHLIEQDFAGSGPSVYYASPPTGATIPTGAAFRPLATPGQKWHHRAILRPGPDMYGARSYQLQTRFFDVNGTQLASESFYAETFARVPAGVFHRWFGARNDSVSERYEGTTKRRNLILDPSTTDTKQWIVNSATGEIASGRLRATPTGASTAYIYPRTRAGETDSGAGRVAVTPGHGYQFQVEVSNPTSTPLYIRVGVAWYTSTGAGSGASTNLSPIYTIDPGTTYRASRFGVVPADGGTTGALPLVYAYNNAAGATADANQVFDTANWSFESGPGVSATVLNAPFTGDTIVPISGVLNRWTGTERLSTSQRIDANGLRTNDSPEPLMNNAAYWYRDPKATYDMTRSYVMAITATSQMPNGTLLTYPLSNLPAGPGDIKASRYKVQNTSKAPIQVYGNIRAYSATGATGDSPTSAITTLQPGEIGNVYVPGYQLPAGTTGYRPLLRTAGLEVGQSVEVQITLFESVAAVGLVVGSYFDGAQLSDAVLPTGTTGPFTAGTVHTAPAGTATARAYIQSQVTGSRDSDKDSFFIDDWAFAAHDSDTLVPFFTGANSNTAAALGDAFYLGGDSFRGSRLITGTRATSVIELATVTGRYGPMVAALAVRSRQSASVLAELISADDGTVLAARDMVLGETWERIALVTPTGRSVRVRFTAKGRFDLDQIVVENASRDHGYFDGSSPAPAPRDDIPELAADLGVRNRYSVRWEGRAHASASILAFDGGLYFQSDDSRVRPILRSLAGTLRNVSLMTANLREITLQEQLEPTERFLHDVAVVEGPKVVEKVVAPQSGIHMAKIEMILVAEQPHVYSRPTELSVPTDWFKGPLTDYTQIVGDLVLENRASGNPLLTTGAPEWTDVSVPDSMTSVAYQNSGSNPAQLALPGVANSGIRFQRVTFTKAITGAATVTPRDPNRVKLPPLSEQPAGRLATVQVAVFVRASRNRSITLSAAVANSANATVTSRSMPTVLQAGVWKRVVVFISNLPTTADNVVTTLLGSSFQAGEYIDIAAPSLVHGAPKADYPFFYALTPSTPDYTYRAVGSISVQTPTSTDPMVVLTDPTLPVIGAPPRPPSITTNYGAGTTWYRGFVTLPKVSGTWATLLPTLRMRSKIEGGATRDVRFRFYENPFEYAPEDVDPTAYCGEVIVPFLPGNTELIIDGVSRSTFARIGAATPVPADNMVQSSDGGPIDWPELRCGVPYVVTVEYLLTTGTSSPNQLAAIDFDVTRKE